MQAACGVLGSDWPNSGDIVGGEGKVGGQCKGVLGEHTACEGADSQQFNRR